MNRTQTARRSPWRRYVAFVLLVLLMPVFAFGTAVAATGIVTVSVHERGEDGIRFYLPVPALLVDLAVFAAPRVMPADARADLRREVAPYRDQIETLAHELASCPSGVLVDIETGDEHVRVTKGWRSFKVEVDADDVDVSVTVPARLAGRVLDVL